MPFLVRAMGIPWGKKIRLVLCLRQKGWACSVPAAPSQLAQLGLNPAAACGRLQGTLSVLPHIQVQVQTLKSSGSNPQKFGANSQKSSN